jgi:hypothetical protein
MFQALLLLALSSICWRSVADSVAVVRAGDGSPSLSASNVLIPLRSRGRTVQYTLSASSGCFAWTSSNPAVVTVEPILNDRACDLPLAIDGTPLYVVVFEPVMCWPERQQRDAFAGRVAAVLTV